VSSARLEALAGMRTVKYFVLPSAWLEPLGKYQPEPWFACRPNGTIPDAQLTATLSVRMVSAEAAGGAVPTKSRTATIADQNAVALLSRPLCDIKPVLLSGGVRDP